MLVAGVVQDQVGHDPQATGVGFLDQFDGVGQHPVGGQDREEVGDVVAAVPQGRLVERQQPEAVDTQPLQVVETAGESSQVTLTVAIGIVEPAHENFVEDRLLVPPGIALIRVHRALAIMSEALHA